MNEQKNVKNIDDEEIKNEVDREGGVSAFSQLFFLILAKDCGYSFSADRTMLVKQNYGTVEFIAADVLTEESVGNIELFFDNFTKRYGFMQNYGSMFFRFIHIADGYGEIREKAEPLLKKCEKKCTESRIICEFDVIDIKTRESFKINGGKIGDRQIRAAVKRALDGSGSFNEKLKTEKADAGKKMREMKEELSPRRVNRLFNISTLIIAINIIIFTADTSLRAGGNGILRELFIQSNELVGKGEIYRLFTSMFLHADTAHLAGNMTALFFIGYTVLKYYSPLEFSAIYFLGGLFGNILSFVFAPPYINSLGASGAVMALGGAIIYRMFFGKYKRIFRRTGNCLSIALLVIFNLVYGLTQPQTDNLGHFGGFAAGFAAAWLIYLIRKKKKERKNEYDC